MKIIEVYSCGINEGRVFIFLSARNADTTNPKLTNQMKKETASQAMTRKASEFEELMEKIRNEFYDLPAPDTDGLTWGHVGDASRIVGMLSEIVSEY